MKAVLLVGGLGTRLRPLTDNRPKSIVPVLNRPVLEHTIAYLKRYGVKDIILTLNFLPDAIQALFGDGKKWGVRLYYCIEKEPAGTAGAVKNAEQYIGKDSFFVLNGDVFTDMDLKALLAFHRAKKAKATISLTWVDKPGAFGVVETDADKRVQAFIEKPPPGTETTNWINAGTYVLEPDVLQDIPPNQHYMFENGLFPGLVRSGKPVYGYEFKGYWLDMGTPAKYFTVNMDFLASKVVRPLIGLKGKNGIYLGKKAVVDGSAALTPPVLIGDGCKIGRNVKITGPAVIGAACAIGDDASVSNAVIWDGVNIAAGASVARSIVAGGVSIGENQTVTDSVVTSDKNVPLSFPGGKNG